MLRSSSHTSVMYPIFEGKSSQILRWYVRERERGRNGGGGGVEKVRVSRERMSENERERGIDR